MSSHYLFYDAYAVAGIGMQQMIRVSSVHAASHAMILLITTKGYCIHTVLYCRSQKHMPGLSETPNTPKACYYSYRITRITYYSYLGG